jgi:hypothetical protein
MFCSSDYFETFIIFQYSHLVTEAEPMFKVQTIPVGFAMDQAALELFR